MAKDIKENRVVKPKDVVSQPRKKWEGHPLTEEEKKECKKVWDEIEKSITYLTTKATKKESKKGKENTTMHIKKK